MSSRENTDSGSTRKWVLRKRAEKEVDEIFEYLERERPSAAIRFGERLLETWDLLARMPLLGRVARSTRMLRKGYRYFVVDEYNVYYKVKEDRVEVYHVLHAAREGESWSPRRSPWARAPHDEGQPRSANDNGPPG